MPDGKEFAFRLLMLVTLAFVGVTSHQRTATSAFRLLPGMKSDLNPMLRPKALSTLFITKQAVSIGSGVLVERSGLDRLRTHCHGLLTKFARNLLRHVFSPEELQGKSLYGKGSNRHKDDPPKEGLDPARLDAVIGVQDPYNHRGIVASEMMDLPSSNVNGTSGNPVQTSGNAQTASTVATNRYLSAHDYMPCCAAPPVSYFPQHHVDSSSRVPYPYVIVGALPELAFRMPCNHIVCPNCYLNYFEWTIRYTKPNRRTGEEGPEVEWCPADWTRFEKRSLVMERMSFERLLKELVCCSNAAYGCNYRCELRYLRAYDIRCPYGPGTSALRI
ncbi:hypothetical protein HPB50_002174 [Hyalomma asiaticum]|uniref:Uncharacterized protein n=1 Tax=Hyalomma asiaticum TaxID=266040 RepID=A0ACB7RH96_HYAAI|nr:hypothetical protein HPB50_002174 [Hyalomma asiaticum]